MNTLELGVSPVMLVTLVTSVLVNVGLPPLFTFSGGSFSFAVSMSGFVVSPEPLSLRFSGGTGGMWLLPIVILLRSVQSGNAPPRAGVPARARASPANLAAGLRGTGCPAIWRFL